MKITEKISRQINKMLAGTTFKYQQLCISNKEYSAAAKAIERLIAKKIIKQISTGVFYKPKKTLFGELKTREEELLRPYMFIGDKRIAYITGTALYNSTLAFFMMFRLRSIPVLSRYPENRLGNS